MRLARTPVTLALAVVVVLLAAPVSPAGAVVGSAPDTAIETNGALNAIASTADRVYLGGTFTRAGVPTGPGADLALSDGARNLASARPNGVVSAVVSDGAGGWFIGGQFTRVGSLTRNSVAHLRADGSVDPAFDPNLNGASGVLALARVGSTLYVGGAFSVVNGTSTDTGGTARNNLAAFDTTTGAVVAGFNPNLSGTVNALLASGSVIYAGGTFTTVNGATTRNRLAALDPSTGTATSFNPNLASTVASLALAGGTLYVGGSFTTVNGSTARNRLAAFDTSTGTATSFNPNISTSGSSVDSLLLSGTTLYAGGSFQRVNGTTFLRERLAAFNTTTATATSFNPDINTNSTATTTVSALAMSGTTLYAGGNFNDVMVNTATRNRLAAFDASSGGCLDNGVGQPPQSPCLVASFDPNLDGAVSALAIAGTRIYAGGGFQFANADTIRNGLAAMKPDGSLDASFAPTQTAGATVRALTVSGTRLYVGSSSNSSLIAFDTTTGSLLPGFTAIIGNGVAALAVAGGKVYAGGDFTMSNQTPVAVVRNRVAAFDATTGALDPFNPNVNAPVSAITVLGGKLYVGGNFTVVNGATVAAGGTARNRLAAFDLTTGVVDPTFNPDVGDIVSALTTSSGRLFAGGSFTTVNGSVARSGLAALDPATGAVDATFDAHISHAILALSLSGTTLYAGGDSATLDSSPSGNALFAFDAAGSGGALAAFDPGLSTGRVNALHASGSHLYAGGTFTSLAGRPRLAFAQFSDTTPPPVPPVPVSGAASAITNTGVTLAGTVNPGGAAATYTFEYGPSTTFGSHSAFTSAGAGTAAVPISASLTGLAPDTTYYYRLVAKDGSGTSYFGAVLSFNTGPGGAPIVTTGAVSAVTTSGATLSGTVDSHGKQTAFTFEYGTSFALSGATLISAVDSQDAVDGALAVSLPISGLSTHTTVYYRLVATNSAGTTFGAVSSFITGGGAAAPIVTTLPATSTTAASATLAGTVNPNGQQTAYTFEYGTTTSFGSITTVVALDSAIAGEAVGATLSGLSSGTRYLYRVVATNATGTSAGAVQSFTTVAAGGA